jgi:hypothetical protein
VPGFHTFRLRLRAAVVEQLKNDFVLFYFELLLNLILKVVRPDKKRRELWEHVCAMGTILL